MSDSLRSVILQEIKAKFPSIDWKLGSVVRELVVEPLAKLGDILDSYVNKAKTSLDVSSICNQPERYEEELDSWLDRLNIVPVQAAQSTGTVRIMRTEPEDLTIVAGTLFTWDDSVGLYAEDTYNVTRYPNPTLTNNIVYKSYDDVVFSVDIPVTCSEYSNASLGSGAPLNWQGAPTDVYDIYVGSAVSGGSGSVGASEKARLIADALTPDALTGEACIRKTLRRNFPNLVKDVVTGSKDINKPYAVSLYIKPVNGLREFDIQADFIGGKAKISGCGVYSILGIYDRNNKAQSGVAVKYPDNLGETGSFIDLSFRSELPTDKYTVRVFGFPEYPELSEWLYSESKNTPFSFVLKTPAVALIRMNMRVFGDDNAGAKAAIADAVNDLSINAGMSDTAVEQIANQYNVSLVNTVAYSAEVYDKDRNFVHTSFKSVSPETLRYSVSSPIVAYSQTNLIEMISD